MTRAMAFAATATALACASPAAAEPVYFHKAGVAREAFEADFTECIGLARGIRVQRQNYYSPNLYASAVGGFLSGFMAAKERRHMTDNVLRTCMADKGYRRVEATDAVADGMKKLDDKARAERLFALAAAPEPEGKVLPQ